MTIVITGADGLIGRHLVPALAGKHHVVAVGRQVPPRGERADRVTADLTSAAFTAQLPDRADAVVHLAQSRYYAAFPEQALDVFAVNVASTAYLLDWSNRAGVRRFVLASAGGAERADSSKQLSYYLASKRSSELLAQSYADRFAVTVLRFFFVYGRGQRRSMLIPRLVDRVRGNEPIALQGADGIRINPVHVDDAVRAIETAVQTDSPGTFDVAGPDVLSMGAIGMLIGAKLGVKPFFVHEPGAARDLIGDIGPMSTYLAPPRRSLESGLDDVF